LALAKGPEAEVGLSRPERPLLSAGMSVAGEAPPDRQDEPLRLVHHHAGYLRVRAAAFLQSDADGALVRAARTAAETVPGFRSWSFNPRTGSVVIQYDPGALEADDLLNHIARAAGFRGVEVATHTKVNRKELVSTFLDGVQDVNRTISQLTGDRADLRELVPVALLATAVVSFVVNDPSSRLPNWFSSLYRSYRVFMHWHRREVRTRERVAREAEERTGPDHSTSAR
jgi:hypothetical protein